nr:RNA-dependent RNA polymerase [Rosellinia necatrix megatotivirus 1]
MERFTGRDGTSSLQSFLDSEVRDNPHVNRIKNKLFSETAADIDKVLEKTGQVRVNIQAKNKQDIINMLKKRIADDNMSRPFVVAHRNYGKTFITERSPTALDIDDFTPSEVFSGEPNQILARGQNPYRAILMASRMGKTKLSHNNPGKVVDIDDIMKLLSKDIKNGDTKLSLNDKPDVLIRKLDDNFITKGIMQLIKDNLHLYIDGTKIVLLHGPSEVPDGMEVLDCLSMPYYKHTGESDDWHKVQTYDNTVRDCLSYKQPVTSWLQVRTRLLRYDLRMPNDFKSSNQPIGKSSIVPLKHWNFQTHPDGWQIFNKRKYAFQQEALNAAFPEGWATRGRGALLYTHSVEDVKRLGGMLLAVVEYTGNDGMDLMALHNRNSTRKAASLNGQTVIRLSDRKMNLKQHDRLWSMYSRKFASTAWFEQFKLDKIEQNVIKTWDEQTIKYLHSTQGEWCAYQLENDVLFQNWFMDNETYKLKRFRTKEWNYHLAYISDCAMLLKQFNPHVFSFLLAVCETFNLTYQSYSKVMKLTSNMVKAFNNSWCPGWMDWVDLARLAGFSMKFDAKLYAEDIKSWLLESEKSRHYVEGSELKFLSEFEKSVEVLLANDAPKNGLTIKQFLNDPSKWAVSGSAKGVELPRLDNGRKLRKTKRAAGFLLQYEELRAAFDRDVSDNYVFDKKEPNRNRPVINSDLGMYLKMSYLDDLVYKMVSEEYSQCSPIFKNFDYLADKTYQVKHIGRKNRICLPLDQSGFERQTSFAMLDKILSVIERRLAYDDIESRQTVKLIRSGIFNSTLHFDDAPEIDGQRIINGLSSGWKWTALINTIINLAEFITCARLLDLQYHNLCALGDDTRVQLKSYADARAVLDWYKSASIDINEKLAIMSHTCDEFLRKVTQYDPITKRRWVSGYYNRMLVAIMYKNPKSADPADVNEAIETCVSNWMQLFSRIGDASKVAKLEQHLYSDVDNILKHYNVRADHRVLHTPRSEGGFGVSRLEPGGPAVVMDYEAINHQVPLSARRQMQIQDNLLTTYRLPNIKLAYDRTFASTLISDEDRLSTFKVVSSTQPAPRRSHNVKYTNKKLTQFGDELIEKLNSPNRVTADLLLSKGDYIPEVRDGLLASGMFSSLFEQTPDNQKRYLFTRPIVYDQLVEKFGRGRAAAVIFKGLDWVQFRSWEFDVDFFNLIAAQYVLFWLSTNLNKYMTLIQLQLFMETEMHRLMSKLHYQIRN